MADREKVLTQLVEISIGLDMAGYHNDAQCVRDALALLREPARGWVSVTERMPEEGGEYIAFDGETVFGAYYEIGTSGTGWTDATEGYDDFRVTHWMPLPGAPEEVSGDG